MASTQTLINHDAIREWAEAHGASPARLRHARGAPDIGLDLHIAGRDNVRPIDWETWFQAFDRYGLALLVETNTHEPSSTNRLIPRSPRRVRTGAVPRRRRASGAHQPIGARATSSAEPRPLPARQPRQTKHIKKLDKKHGRRRSKGGAARQRSEARGRSRAQKS
jgi:hypothetical protein